MPAKRVLIITYYWPPSGGIGVHRCLKFAKYLRKFGWEPVIFTAENPQYPVLDPSNEKHIPENLEVHRIPIIEPFTLFRKFSGRKADESANPVYVRDKKRSLVDELSIWIRGNFFIPDARALWIRPAVRKISNYLEKKGNIDAIFSDGPPHTNNRIAWHLARRYNIPWIADFQDPWTQVDYYKLLKIGIISDKIHKRMEQAVFRAADIITIASPSWANDLKKIGANDVRVLFYGYDEEDFSDKNISTRERSRFNIPESNFVICHAGLLGIDRFPEAFLEVLAELAEEIPLFKKKLTLYFPGDVDYGIKHFIEKIQLHENVIYPGYISKDKAIISMILSNLLLLPLNKAENARGRLPGKLYEYMRSFTYILALGPEVSDVKQILKKTGAGVNIAYDDRNKLKNFVLERFKKFESGEAGVNPVTRAISEFSVENQTRKLGSMLDEITNQPRKF